MGMCVEASCNVPLRCSRRGGASAVVARTDNARRELTSGMVVPVGRMRSRSLRARREP
jgi:hypothetical protein